MHGTDSKPNVFHSLYLSYSGRWLPSWTADGSKGNYNIIDYWEFMHTLIHACLSNTSIFTECFCSVYLITLQIEDNWENIQLIFSTLFKEVPKTAIKFLYSISLKYLITVIFVNSDNFTCSIPHQFCGVHVLDAIHILIMHHNRHFSHRLLENQPSLLNNQAAPWIPHMTKWI